MLVGLKPNAGYTLIRHSGGLDVQTVAASGGVQADAAVPCWQHPYVALLVAAFEIGMGRGVTARQDPKYPVQGLANSSSEHG